jgi:hypothetical protein
VDTELEIVPPLGRPFTVEYELHLAEGVVPGTYPLPVHVELIPLHRVDPSGHSADGPTPDARSTTALTKAARR